MSNKGELKLYEVRDVEMSPVDSETVMDYGWTVVVDYADYEKLKNSSEELHAYCEMLENIVMERGINADFMWEAKKAMDKIGLINGLYDETSDDEYGKTLLDQIAEVLDGDYPVRKDNADFMWKAKRAMETLEKLKGFLQEYDSDDTLFRKTVLMEFLNAE